MHYRYFEIPRRTQSLIAYKTLTEYFWKFQWKIALWEQCQHTLLERHTVHVNTAILTIQQICNLYVQIQSVQLLLCLVLLMSALRQKTNEICVPKQVRTDIFMHYKALEFTEKHFRARLRQHTSAYAYCEQRCLTSHK